MRLLSLFELLVAVVSVATAQAFVGPHRSVSVTTRTSKSLLDRPQANHDQRVPSPTSLRTLFCTLMEFDKCSWF